MPSVPVPRGVMEKSFMEYYDFYEGVCKERLYLQGQTMQVSAGGKTQHQGKQHSRPSTQAGQGPGRAPAPKQNNPSSRNYF